jgi:hypothetical protein
VKWATVQGLPVRVRPDMQIVIVGDWEELVDRLEGALGWCGRSPGSRDEGVTGRPVRERDSVPVLWFFKGLQGGKFSSRPPRGCAAAVDAVSDRASSGWLTLGK